MRSNQCEISFINTSNQGSCVTS